GRWPSNLVNPGPIRKTFNGLSEGEALALPCARATATLVRKPDAGNLPVRFDERDLETEHSRATAPDLDSTPSYPLRVHEGADKPKASRYPQAHKRPGTVPNRSTSSTYFFGEPLKQVFTVCNTLRERPGLLINVDIRVSFQVDRLPIDSYGC